MHNKGHKSPNNFHEHFATLSSDSNSLLETWRLHFGMSSLETIVSWSYSTLCLWHIFFSALQRIFVEGARTLAMRGHGNALANTHRHSHQEHTGATGGYNPGPPPTTPPPKQYALPNCREFLGRKIRLLWSNEPDHVYFRLMAKTREDEYAALGESCTTFFV